MGRSVRMLAKPIEISAWWARRGGRKRKRGELDEEEPPTSMATSSEVPAGLKMATSRTASPPIFVTPEEAISMAPKRGMPKRGIPKVSIQAIHLTMANLQLGFRPVRQVSAESIARTESILGCPTVSVGTRGCTLLATVHAEDGTQKRTASRKQVQ